jgi:hypothetical protein
MGTKRSAEALVTQIEDVRDRAADLLASNGGSRPGSTWPGRMLWFALGMGIGAAASGGRMLNALPSQLASRLDDLVGRATSAATGLAEKAGLGGETSELIVEETSPGDVTIDVSDPAAEALTEG